MAASAICSKKGVGNVHEWTDPMTRGNMCEARRALYVRYNWVSLIWVSLFEGHWFKCHWFEWACATDKNNDLLWEIFTTYRHLYLSDHSWKFNSTLLNVSFPIIQKYFFWCYFPNQVSLVAYPRGVGGLLTWRAETDLRASAAQSQNAATGYLKSNQLLPFGFAPAGIPTFVTDERENLVDAWIFWLVKVDSRRLQSGI